MGMLPEGKGGISILRRRFPRGVHVVPNALGAESRFILLSSLQNLVMTLGMLSYR